LERFAELGIRALRYPVLWERTAPYGVERADWSWPDERLGRLRELGIRPIVGLTHHGSGPPHTDLASESFVEGLASFARGVAERYPWIEDFTPVNEPLTTARFSGLYGHWYPHARSDQAMARMLTTQCRATVLAMRAVREVTPHARLIQTEDLAKTHSTPCLAYQADLENERRWLTFDLLCGKLTSRSSLWRYFVARGVPTAELAWLRDNPCPPDIFGCNYYVTSERYLDQRLLQFPAWSHGGNGRHRYADVEAARWRPEGNDGLATLLVEAWRRYGRPLAVTEAHLGGPREAQMQWLIEAWNGALAARAAGADIRAVTVWSLLGSFDWNSLLTRTDGFYEPGPFDVRTSPPRRTALATVAKGLATGKVPDSWVPTHAPWWRRTGRSSSGGKPILITGAGGMLGKAFVRVCNERGLVVAGLSRRELDIGDPQAVAEVLEQVAPWAIINAAGYVRIDEAERDLERCRHDNVVGAAVLAEACAERRLPFLTFSSDLVFDGRLSKPYREPDPTAPLSVYGRSKVEAEAAVLERWPRSLVIRTSTLFGPWDTTNCLYLGLSRLAAGAPLRAASDHVVSPTYVPDLVGTALDLLIDEEGGLWHLANGGAATFAELAIQAARLAGFDPGLVEGCPTCELGLAAPRPIYSALDSDRGRLMPSLDGALAYYCRRFREETPTPAAVG
jgi:dTDP-4-dehydrorhamnose reductase